MKDPEIMKLGYPCPYCNRGSCYALENENGAVRCFRCSRNFFYPALSKWQALVKAYRSKVAQDDTDRFAKNQTIETAPGEITVKDFNDKLEKERNLRNRLRDFEEWSNCGHE